jgi:DNA-binding CsgD family transcriptional regulator
MHNNSLRNIPSSLSPSNRVTDPLQDALSTARVWAADEVGAAIAHRLNEPLTALLLYLHEIKDKSEHSTGAEEVPEAIREMVQKALRETERVCDIMERTCHTFDAPADVQTSVARGREAINWLTRSDRAKTNGTRPAPARQVQTFLTPREREVLDLITGGAYNKEGAHRLGISKRTFEVHRAHIMKKLGAKNAADLVRMALNEQANGVDE